MSFRLRPAPAFRAHSAPLGGGRWTVGLCRLLLPLSLALALALLLLGGFLAIFGPSTSSVGRDALLVVLLLPLPVSRAR